MSKILWCTILAIAGLICASDPLFAQPAQRQNQGHAANGPADTLPPLAPAPSANAVQGKSQPCIGAEHGDLSCDAIAAKASYDQARDADRQIVIGWLQATGLVLSLFFSALATRAAFRAVKEAAKGAKASSDTLEETKRMNAAVVRPVVAVESAKIYFEIGSLRPVITLTTRNASQYIAHDWEWAPLLKYVTRNGERKCRLFPWGDRGIRGVSLPPGDVRTQMPANLSFALDMPEQIAATELELAEGLQIFLTVFSRCYDAFGNPVEDRHHFAGTMYNLFSSLAENDAVAFEIELQPTPPGTQVEGQEDRIPERPK